MNSKNWQSKSKKALEEEFGSSKPKEYSDSEIDKLFDGKKSGASGVCAVLYSLDGCGKSGIILDSRTEEEKAAGKKVVVIDLDQSCAPLKYQYYRNDDNVIVIDPWVLKDNGEVDYVSTYNKILAIVKRLKEREDEMNLATVALDGLDSLLKIAEYVMRYEDLKIDADTQIKDSWNWSKRNRRYYTIIFLIKMLKCKKFFTTHLREVKRWGQQGLVTIGYAPNWQEDTPGKVFQKIKLERVAEKQSGDVEFIAYIEKAKGNLELEGRKYTIAEVKGGKHRWYGLHEFLEEVENA